MSNPNRTPGLRGRLPVKPEGERFALRWLHEYMATPLPAPKYPIDVSGGIPAASWAMLGNGPDPTCTTHPDGVGDCTFAAREHYKYAKAACNGETEQHETSNALVAEYLKYDHGQDEGAVIADLLLAWYKAGLILGFAPVDHTSPAAIDSAMGEFDGVYLGVSLTDDADQLFTDGQAWTVAHGEQPDPGEGHCILGVKATANSRTYVTWGAEQAATAAWSTECVDEAWVILMSEDDGNKVRLAELQADINALHGTGGNPAPVPTPTPAPTPTPTPVPAPQVLLTDLAALIRERATHAKLLAFLSANGI